MISGAQLAVIRDVAQALNPRLPGVLMGSTTYQRNGTGYSHGRSNCSSVSVLRRPLVHQQVELNQMLINKNHKEKKHGKKKSHLLKTQA